LDKALKELENSNQRAFTSIARCAELKRDLDSSKMELSGRKREHKAEMADERRSSNKLKRELDKAINDVTDLTFDIAQLEDSLAWCQEDLKQKNEELDKCGNELDVTKASNADALENAIMSERSIRIAAVDAVVNKMQKLRSALSEEKQNSLTLLENERLNSSNALLKEKQMSLIMLAKEKHAMETKLNESISRERQYRNDAIEFSKTKLTKKVTSVKTSLSEVASELATVRLEEQAKAKLLMEQERLRHKNEVADIENSYAERIKNLRERHCEAIALCKKKKHVGNKIKAVGSAVSALGTELEFCREEVKAKAEELRVTKKKLNNVGSVSSARLEREQALKIKYDELQDRYAELKASHENVLSILNHHEQKEQQSNSLESMIQKERPIGRKGGRSRWPPHIVQLICEQLVNGTPPSAIPANIVSMFALNGIVLDDVPSVNYCRQCRTVVQVLVETLTIKRLAETEFWGQIFFNGTKQEADFVF
jgi:DNA repair exonuclease SbcCD ATPase subunit